MAASKADGPWGYVPVTPVDTVWGRLVPDPLGRSFQVLRCRINQSDYEKVPTNNKTTYGKRCEIIIKPEQFVWGQLQTFYWRFIIDPRWQFLPGETTTIVHQVHEMGESASPPANPVIAATFSNGLYQIGWRNDLIPGGQFIYSGAAKPGDEIEVFARLRWADVSHVPADQGIFEWAVNGQPVFEANGVQNTWNVPEDEHPPYMTAGCYRYDPTAPWWADHEKTMFHVAAAVGDDDETLQSMRLHVQAQLGLET